MKCLSYGLALLLSEIEVICVENEYKDWLFGLVRPRRGRRNVSYYNLFDLLWRKEFYSLVKYDEDRAADGLTLRDKWAHKAGIGAEEADFGPARTLEVLIYLAIRASEILYDGDNGLKFDVFFWEMMENCGLIEENDGDFDLHLANEKVENVLERRYLSNGEGGLFPLSSSQKNQRRISLWYQLNAYLIEKYPIVWN